MIPFLHTPTHVISVLSPPSKRNFILIQHAQLNQENVAPNSPSPVHKTKIQLKLEKWEPASPSMESIQSRLNEANLRRESKLSNLSEQAGAHIKVVKNVFAERQNQIQEEAISIQERLSCKKQRATEQVEKVKAMYSTKGQEKSEKIARVMQNAKIAQDEISQKVEEKWNRAAERKDKNFVDVIVKKNSELNKMKVKKVEEWQEKENSKLQALEAKSQSKLAAATERKQEVLSNIVENNANSTKKKMERAKLLLESKNAEVETTQKKLQDKLLTATERKELNLAAKAAKAAEENKIVAQRVQEVHQKRLSSVHEMQVKHENKLESASKRVARRQLEDVTRLTSPLAERMERAKQNKFFQDEGLSNIQMKLDEKLSTATERKEMNLAAKVAKAAESNKVVVERVEVMQKKKKEEVLEIQKKLDEKLSTAAERKEMNLAAKVAKASGDNKIVAERVQEVQKKQDEGVSEIQKKLEEKLSTASERKDMNLAAKVAKAAEGNKIVTERIQEVQKKQEEEISEIQKKLEEKLSTASERKEMNLAAKAAKAAEGNKIVSERIQEVQKKQEEGISEIQKKLEEKLSTANEKKEQNIAFKAAKAAEGNKVVAEKVLEVQKKRLATIQDIQMKTEAKLQSVAERKDKILLEKIGNKSQPESETPKENVSLDRASDVSPNENVNEDAEDTTRTEKGMSGGNSQAAKNIFEIIQMVPILIFTNFLNFFKGIFRADG